MDVLLHRKIGLTVVQHNSSLLYKYSIVLWYLTDMHTFFFFSPKRRNHIWRTCSNMRVPLLPVLVLVSLAAMDVLPECEGENATWFEAPISDILLLLKRGKPSASAILQCRFADNVHMGCLCCGLTTSWSPLYSTWKVWYERSSWNNNNYYGICASFTDFIHVYVAVNTMIHSELLTKQRQLRKMTDTMCPLWSFSTARKFFCDGFNVSINTNKLSYGGSRSACSEQNIGLLRIKEHNLLKKSQCYKVRI